MFPADALFAIAIVNQMYGNTVTIDSVYPVAMTPLIRVVLSDYTHVTVNPRTREATVNPD